MPITAAAQAMAQAAGLPPGTQAAIVEGEDGEQQIYIIQTAGLVVNAILLLFAYCTQIKIIDLSEGSINDIQGT